MVDTISGHARAARWVTIFVVVAGVTLLAGARPAAAHASLASSTPADGARLDSAPSRITLTFTEKVSLGLDGIRVLDSDGSRIDEGSVEVDGVRATVDLQDSSDGAYVVAWRAISADSHPIDGVFTYLVGDAASSLDRSVVDSLVGGDDDGPWRIAGTVSRFLGYGGALLAAGLGVFLVTAYDGGAERKVLRRMLRIGAAVGAVGIVVELPARAVLATGLGPDSITENGVLGRLLGDNVGIGLAVGLGSLLLLAASGARDRVVVGLSVVGMSLGFAIAGHTAATSPLVVAILSDATHVAAAAIWFGGLAGAVVVLVRRRQLGTSAAPVIVRFSVVGGFALAGVAIGGSILGWTQVQSVDALVTTTYGQLLLAKVAVVTVVAMFGGWNHYRLVPVLEQDLARAGGAATEAADAGAGAGAGAEELGHDDEAGDITTTPEIDAGAVAVATASPTVAEGGQALSLTALKHLRVTLVCEVALLVLVLAMTAVLVDVTPARAAVAKPFTGTAPLGDGRAELTVDPTRTGRTQMHIFLYDEDGAPLDAPEGVSVRMALPSADMSGIERDTLVGGPGHWTLTTDDLSLAGDWKIDVVANTSRFDQEVATFDVRIAS